MEDLEARLAAEYPRMIRIKADEIAESLGNRRCMNMVLAGALSTITPFEADLWKEAARQRLPAKLVELNLKAFDCGREAAAK